jgi:hypothetical protein
MKKKLKIVVLVGCLLILVNVGIAGISTAADVEYDEKRVDEQIPVQLVKHADANGPYSGTVNHPVSFSGLGTYVGSGSTYEWDFNDPYDENNSIGYGKYQTHSYSVPGDYIVTLTVTENSGGVFKDIAPVFIDEPGDHLIPYGGCHYPADVNEEIEFNASESVSNGADIVNYSWDFGDETTGYGEVVTHSYDEERVYMVCLEVTDSNGVTRYDVLHADIGMSYSDDDDFYCNLDVNPYLQDFLEWLLDTLDFETGFFCSIFDAKIYTKYNGIEKLTELSGSSPLPKQIDVNGDGDKDIKVNNLEFFDTVKSKSLFGNTVWYQFETKLSDVRTISSDIQPEDDFIVCLQLDLDIIASYLGLDDTIMRIGYHSAPGEAMPTKITVTHILRPYILWRILGHDIWPEYGLRIDEREGGSFSLIGMLLNSGGSSKTTFKCSFESLGSNIMYKRTKTGGIFDHSAIIKIPSGNEVILSLIREKNAVKTELSSGFLFTGTLLRSFRIRDQEIEIGVSGDTQASLYDFYFDNPDCTITLGEASIGTSGSFDINFDKSGGTFSLLGVGTGFTLSDLLIDSKNTEFEGEIQGVLNLELASSFHIGLSQGELVVGFNEQITLSSDCVFRVNEETVTVGGEFTIESPGDITFSWGGNQFNVDLEAGLNLRIQNFNFEVGNLIANASFIEIDTSGSFGIEWDSANGLVTINGGPGASMSVTNLDFEYVTDTISFYVSVYGTLEIQAGGWVTFGANTFEAGFEGSLDLGTGGAFCEFVVNGENIKVGGIFTLDGGAGGISFSWANNEFTLDVIGNPELSVDDLYFEINFDSGNDIIAIAENIGIGMNGEFNIVWDSVNNEVTVNAIGGVSLSITNLDISYTPSLNIKIFGTLEIEAGGWLTFGEDTFKAGFDGSLNLGTEGNYVTFEINGKNIHVGGKFTLIGGSGEISFEWSNGQFSLSVSGGPELSVTDLYFKAKISDKDLEITADGINVGANGDISVHWDTTNNEITITSDLGVAIGVEDFTFDFNSGSLNVQIIGSFEIQADGYVTIGEGTFVAGFTGSLNLGGVGLLNFCGGSQGSPQDLGGNIAALGDGYCEFIINGESLYIGGLFTLSTGEYGEISFTWDGDDFSLYVSSDVTLTVEELYFKVEIQQNRQANILEIDVGEVSIGADGDFSLDWDTTNNEITLDSEFDVSLSVTDFNFSYGPLNNPTLEISIIGTLEIQVDGYITLGEGTFEAGFTGVLNLGTGGDYCEFTVNDESIKIGGKYTLTSGSGTISFYSDEDEFSLYVSGSPSLSVQDLYFEAGDLKVTGENISIGANGDFSLDWDTVNNEITISSDAGVSLSIQNVNITYGTILDVKIFGSLDLQADGWLTFGSGTFKAGFSGTLDLGSQCEFEINGDSITVGGLFTLTVGSGEISFYWADGEFSLSVSGGPELIAQNLYFLAEIQNEELELSIDSLSIAADGDLTVEWFTAVNKIKFSSDAGVSLDITNVSFSYGSLSALINGTIHITANGFVSISTGSFEASFSGVFYLIPGFNFEINGESISLSGNFSLTMGAGDIAISWTENEFSCDVSGGVVLSIKYLYFEIDHLKIDSYSVDVGFNGDLTITTDQTNKKFEINCDDLSFGFMELLVYIKENNNWYQICSADDFDIAGGGHLLIESGTLIELDFSGGVSGTLDLSNLQITLPSNWNADLSIGSASIIGNAYLKMQKFAGAGEFIINTVSGSVSGQISSFDAEILLGSNNLEISFTGFTFSGEFSLSLGDDAQFSADGSLDLSNFNAQYGSNDLIVDMDLDGNGDIGITYTSTPKSLGVDADVDFTWDISLESQSFGDWDALGDIEGDVVIYAEWGSGTGYADVTINEPGIFHSIEITYSDLRLSLADISLSPGTIRFEWERNDAQSTGYILIDSDFTQAVCTVNLVEITWGTKTVSVGWPDIGLGDFKFAWDIPGKTVTVNNGIANLGPTLTYEDTGLGLEIFASAGSFQSNYAKTITLKWYEISGQISGLYLDTEGTHLAEWLEAGYIKGSSGKKIAIWGLKCDHFEFKKDESGNFEWSGKIFIANNITISKLYNSNWVDLYVEWDFQGQQKKIRFYRHPDFDLHLELLSAEILGFDFEATVEFVTTYFELAWNIAEQGGIYVDTNNQYLSTLNIVIGPNYGMGVDITTANIRADEWWVAWNVWPPEELYVVTGGTLYAPYIDIDIYWNGEWKHLWPW